MKQFAHKYFSFFIFFGVIMATLAGAFVGSYSVQSVAAQGTRPSSGRVNPLTELQQTGNAALGSAAQPSDPRGVIFAFIGLLLSLTGIVLTVLVLYGGFLWMTARGNDDQVTRAKKTLTNAVIGLVIVAMSYAIVTAVIRALFNPQPGVRCGDMLGLEQGSFGEILAEQTLPFCGS